MTKKKHINYNPDVKFGASGEVSMQDIICTLEVPKITSHIILKNV